MAIRYRDENGNWVTGQKAIETSLLDIQGNYEESDVEGALREIKSKVDSDISKIAGNVQGNTSSISSLKSSVKSLNADMKEAQENIAWLKVNGGGGGGTAVPTITSTFKDGAIDKGSDAVIPIFFSSPNMGAGTAYIVVNNIQVDTAGITQGNNTVRVAYKYLAGQPENLVVIYVKDRAGIVSNQLSWNVTVGGIDLTSTFDYEVDYGITDSIRIPYTIETGITDNITLTLTIDGVDRTYSANNGLNYIDIQASELGLGTHPVKMVATVSKYTSTTLSFNLVIVSTTELYLSSTFESGSEHTYGVPILINYRLSKVSTEEFNVELKIDGNVNKTQKLTVGSYYWTIQNLGVGSHTITIQASSLDYSEVKTLELTLSVVAGEYTPVEDYKLGLLCDLNAVGKSNDDDEVLVDNLWKDASGNGHDGHLVNFNYGTNGFVDSTLVCDNDAYVRIEWSPWETNALTGSTIDIIYTPINSGIEDCRVLDYTQITDDLSTEEIKPFKGVFADILRAIPSSASSGTSSGKVNLDDESGEIHLTWVLDRTNKFMKTYINGVLSRIMYLTDSGTGVNKFYEDFSLDSFIYLNSTKGENCGTNNIKRFRVYDHALTSDNVLKNHLANITDLEAQEREYNFNYNNTTLPKMYLTGDTTNMTATQTVNMKIEYVSTNEEKYGASFNTGIQNNPVRIQGTSSLQYVRHNYTIFLKDEYGKDMYYNPYGKGSVADYVFCLKADYVESSHANNTGVAKFVNDCLYDTKTPSQLDNSECRTAINGFPIEVYVNGEYLGVYNFNHDRYSYQSYGYNYNKFPNMLVYEVNSNSNTSAGAFYRYGDNAESSANVSEHEYYKRDFNLIYGNRTADGDNFSEIKTLVEWVSVAEQDLFREMIDEHFNKEYLFRYYLMVLFIGAVDSLGKNLKLNTWDGKIWYPSFYDLDTVLGIDNSGYLTINPDVEIESGSYNTSNSNLWSKVWNYFNAELKEEWAKMRQGKFTLENLMSYVEGEQISKIPTRLYNEDAQVKYLDFGSLYTYCCHGNKYHQLKRWLRERIAYVDSMMGYFTSQEDQVTIRMNKTGYVEFSVTPYIPLYFSVKWSNATGGTQTFKVARGETKTFYYTSTTSTDQEVIIYHAQYIKSLDNLSNLNPSSCILSNATKLTNVEIHSSELYNINVSNNKYLRNIDLQDCTALGTVTATGSSLDLANCKYLRHCNVYNTNLTEVQLNSSGGSLIDIYYPKTIQSIQLIKQRLLEVVGLPYGVSGAEIPTSLYTINIQECPSISKLNVSEDPTISSTFASMVYVNNLTIRNSLDLPELTFDGFYRLKNVIIENMYSLESIGFNNLVPVGDTSTLKYMGLSNCPKLTEIELNCTSADYEITFADNAILNFGGLMSLKTITSNCVLKGLETIVVPRQLESMFFTSEYGSGNSSVVNIFVSSQCDINTSGTSPKVTHVDGTFKGIDFKGMNLKNIDLGALVNIPKAINFSLSPTTVNPNFNTNRDGDVYPYLQPEGTLDLTNYTESLAKFFNGVNLDKLIVKCNGALPQTDLSYCFYNSSFSNKTAINAILSNVTNITNLDYCFYQTTIDSTDILGDINMGANSTMNYTFAECANITSLSGIVISRNVTAVEGLFSGCPITSITNMTVNVQGSISGLFKGCSKLTSINNLNIPYVTDVSSTFEGCTNLTSLGGFELPESCTSVDNLFNGCYNLTDLSMDFGPNITSGVNWYSPYLETFRDSTISNDAVRLAGCSTLINLNNVVYNIGTAEGFLANTTKLKNINGLTLQGTLTSVASLFKNKSFNTITNLVFGDTITDFSSCFENCSGITDDIVITIPNLASRRVNFSRMFAGCTGITRALDIIYPDSGSNLTSMYEGCTGLTTIKNLTIKSTNLVNMFASCTALNSVEGLVITKATILQGLFYQCSSLPKISFTIPDTCSNINILFNGCTSLTDISGMIFGSGITSADNWQANAPITTADNVTIKAVNTVGETKINFNGCATLVSAKNLKLVPFATSKSFVGQDMFRKCTSLEYVNLIECPKLPYCQSMFQGTKVGKNSNGILNLKNDLGISNSCISGGINAVAMFYDCTYLEEVEFEDSELGGMSVQTMFQGCTNLKKISNFKPVSLNNLFRFVKGATDVELNNCYIPVKFETDGCEGITKLINCTIPDSVTNIDNFFKPATGLYDISGMTFGSGIASAVDWINTSAVTTANNITIKNDRVNFRDCTSLTSCENLTITSDVTSLAQFCYSSGIVNFTMSTESDLANVTTMDEMFYNCTKLDKVYIDWSKCSTNLKTLNSLFTNNFDAPTSNINPVIIPDGVTSIDSIVRNAHNLTDISGWVFGSGIQSAEAWNGLDRYKLITKADNLTIKNNVVKFTDCTTLTSCNNLTITNNVTDLSKMFEGCSSLTSWSFSNACDFNNITSMSYIVKKCSKLTTIDLSPIVATSKLTGGFTGIASDCTNLTTLILPNNLEKSTIAEMTDIASGCKKLIKVYNYRIPPTVTKINGYNFGWVGGATSLTLYNVYVSNCSAISSIFSANFTKVINDIEFAPDVADITELFKACTKLTHDLILPSQITNCTKAFYGCTGMTHVHSNWNNTYTNGITSTDCYAGCTGITHIDDENVIAYVGDSGINYIPKDWGGYGFDIDYTSIYEITTTADNTEIKLLWYHYQFTYFVDAVYASSKNSISWGDGEYLTLPKTVTDSDGTVRNGISGSVAFPTHTYATAGTYYVKGNFIPVIYGGNAPGASYVTKILRVAHKQCYEAIDTGKTTENYISDLNNAFNGLTNVTYINATNLITSTTTTTREMFKGCTKLATIDGMNTWDCSNIYDVFGMFQGCNSLTQLDLNMFNCLKINEFSLFLNGCSGLANLDFSNFKINTTTSCDSIFNWLGVSDITLDNSGVDKYVDLYRSMNCLPNATSVTLKNFKLSSIQQQFYIQCHKLTSVSYINCTMSDTCNVNEYTFNNLPIVNFDFTGTEITVDLLLSNNSVISHESLVNIITNLRDYSSGDSHTLTIGSTNLAKLTTDEITVATNKNWTVV